MSENDWDGKLKEFFSSNQETKVAVCLLCNKDVSFKNTVISLIQHLALAHPDMLVDSFPIVISNEVESRDDNSETIKITCDFNSLFDIDQDSEIATCTLCYDNVPKYSMRSHLKRKHVEVYNNFIVSESNVKNEGNISEVENCSDQENSSDSNRENGSEEIIAELVNVNNSNEEYMETDEEYMIISPEEDGSSKMPKNCSSGIWKLFTRLSNGRAICKQCKNMYSFKSSITNLKKHVQSKHPDLYNTYRISQSKLKRYVPSSPKSPIDRGTLLNGVWDVFEKIKNTKMATCTLCQTVLSYKTTLTNLKVHVQTKHPKIYKKFDLKTPSRKINSHTLAHWWKFFKRLQNTRKAICRVCKKILSYKTTSFNLKVHLINVHPDIYHKSNTSLKLSPSQNDSEEGNSSEKGNNSEEDKGLHRENGTGKLEENIWNNFEKTIEGIPSSEKYSSLEGENDSQRGNDKEEESCFEENNSQLEHIIPKNDSKIKSKMWNFFKRDPNYKRATCSLCQNVLSYKTSITNLKAHIKNKHPYIFYKYFTLSKSASPPRANFDEQNGSKGHLRNKLINTVKMSKSDSTLGKLHEVYIKAGEEKDQTTNEIVLDFHDNSEIYSVSGDSKQMDPFYEDEVINIKQPLKKKRSLSTVNSNVNIKQNEKKAIDRCLLKLITENFYPLNTIEDIGFREFVAALNPKYQLPSRKMLSNLLAEEFSSRMAKYDRITHNCSSISLTLDCWSSCSMQCFMTVTAHFIDQSTYELFSVLINCAAFHGQRTAENIASELVQVTNKCNITDKIKFVVSDGASNMVSATRILNWPHFGCFARKFNLIVQGALNECSLADTVTKVQRIVAYIKSSSIAKEMFRKYQVENQQVAQPKSLSLSIPTQWMTVYEMLKRFSELQLAVRATVSNVDEETKCPLITSEEWECVSQMVEVLKPFVEAATMIASEKYLIAGKAVVLTAGLHKVSTDLAERDFHESVTNLVLKLKNGLSTNFGDIETVEEIAICTLLDPRFKHHAFENQEALLNAKKCVIGRIKRFKKENESIKRSNSSIVQTNSETNTLFGHFYTKVASSFTQDNTDELSRYLAANVIPSAECPLRWWKEQRNLYPVLSRIFVDSFNIVVTSLPGDRIFSKTGNSMSHRRTRLTTSKIDKIMFLNVNK